MGKKRNRGNGGLRKETKRFVTILLLLAALALPLALVLVDKLLPDQTMIPQSVVKLPGQVISAVFRPIQTAFAWAAGGVSDYLESWKLQKTIEIAYNQLRADNDDLSFQALRVEELEAEVERLRAAQGRYDELLVYNPLLANVISREPGNWFQTFIIDVGEADGIEMYMAVVNADGLVGYISGVKDTTASVTTMLDSRAAVPGVIRSSNSFGSIRGTLGVGGEDPSCRMYYLPSNYIPRPNDEVVTSGVGIEEDGTAFPNGLPIGVVRESSRYLDNNNSYFVIEPYVDFQRIDSVYVLVSKPDPEDIPVVNDNQISSVSVVLDTPRPYPSFGAQLSDPNLGGVTPPPRSSRDPGVSTEGDPFTPMPYGPTPTPDPEMEALMRETMERDQRDQPQATETPTVPGFQFGATIAPNIEETPPDAGESPAPTPQEAP